MPPTSRPPDPDRAALIRSRALDRALRDAVLAAPTGCHVLLLGERGVGKERMAQLVHARSGRVGPLVAVNCATIQPALVESTLFGHARGAFTGANAASKGLVRAAEGGTLFLDEVGELPVEVQARLLRLLQERVIQPVGEAERTVDVRVVAATNRDLDEAVRLGLFRADLRDRLSLVVVRVPPLRERTAEILPLAAHFLASAPELANRPRPRLSAGAAAALRAHDWPGNVRELRNVVVGAAILGQGESLSARQIRASLAGGDGQREVTGVVPGLDVLQANRPYRMGELAPLLRMPLGTLKRRVRDWVRTGALVGVGSGPRARYLRPTEGMIAAPVCGVQAQVLAWLGTRGPCSTGKLSSALGVPLSTLKRAVGGLIGAGRVTVSGVGRASRVQMVEESRRSLPQEDEPVATANAAPRREERPPVAPASSTPTARRAAEQEALALRLVREGGATTARSLAEALGRSERTAERVLARLVAGGRLRAEGFARSRRYRHVIAGGTTTGARPPALSLGGRALDPVALRSALLLAARPTGVSPSALAQRVAVPERDAARLLVALDALGLLVPLSGAAPAWRLQLGELGASADTS